MCLCESNEEDSCSPIGRGVVVEVEVEVVGCNAAIREEEEIDEGRAVAGCIAYEEEV